MESAIVPPIYDPTLADRDERVTTEDAYKCVLQLARDEGILVGPSGGAALAASLRVAGPLEQGVIVTIFPDGGDRYLSERFWLGKIGRLRMPRAAGDVIRSHGAATYPDECCGALLGPKQGDIVEAFKLPNEHQG